MAIQNSQLLAAASTASSAQGAGAMTAPPSPHGAPGFAVAPQQVGPVAAPPSLQGAPEFAVVPHQGAPSEAPLSPECPPGFWVASYGGAAVAAAPQFAPMKAPPQQHFAHGSQQVPPMPVQAAPMGITASMPLQAPAMPTLQHSQGTAPPPPLPMGIPHMMEMQQAQSGHMIAPPPLPLGPPPMMMQQQQPPQASTVMMEQPPQPFGYPPMMQMQHQPPQANTLMVEQPPQPFGYPPVMQLQQPPHANPVTMEQPPQPFGYPSLMQQQPPQFDPMMMPHPQLSSPPCKRQRFDQNDMTYGQHMTGHQQEMTVFDATSYGPFLPNGLPCPPNASSTLYIEGLPNDCTKREVAHIFRQYMGFREVRLVNRLPSRQPLCFVDFATPVQAFLAMESLQGYKFDQQDHRSPKLNLQFSHSPRVASSGRC